MRVCFMAGTMVLTDTMKSTFDGVIAGANEGTDVIVQRSGAIDGDLGTTRARVDAAIVDQVAGVDGVASAAGSVQGFAQLVHADGSVATDDGLGVTIGANWIADEELNPFQLADGRAPEAADEAVLDRGTAETEGWEIEARDSRAWQKAMFDPAKVAERRAGIIDRGRHQ